MVVSALRQVPLSLMAIKPLVKTDKLNARRRFVVRHRGIIEGPAGVTPQRHKGPGARFLQKGVRRSSFFVQREDGDPDGWPRPCAASVNRGLQKAASLRSPG